jgi:hypothetical protein
MRIDEGDEGDELALKPLFRTTENSGHLGIDNSANNTK